MIHFFLGTKAQLIKTAPVMLELDRRGIGYRFIDSGQHAAFTADLRETLNLRGPDFRLRAEAGDVATYSSAFSWLSTSLRRYVFNPGWIRQQVFANQDGICVIHGDTISTWLGLLYARRAGIPVAHLEAGLRSFNTLDPFPEEWIRIRCMKKSEVLFAPDQQAIANLKQMKVRGEIVDTGGNTVVDAVRLACEQAKATTDDPPYILATFHRLETLRSRQRVATLVETLNLAAKRFPIKFVIHKPTRKALVRFKLLDQLSDGVEQLPMQNYFEFIRLMKHARFVLADGGSIQEECSILGKPLLILRNRTERQDGLGQTARLGAFDPHVVSTFLDEFSEHDAARELPAGSPARTVADKLANFA